jgi:hypothetical protein
VDLELTTKSSAEVNCLIPRGIVASRPRSSVKPLTAGICIEDTVSVNHRLAPYVLNARDEMRPKLGAARQHAEPGHEKESRRSKSHGCGENLGNRGSKRRLYPYVLLCQPLLTANGQT